MGEEYRRFEALNADYRRIRELPGNKVEIVTVGGNYTISNKEMVATIIDMLIKETSERMKKEV